MRPLLRKLLIVVTLILMALAIPFGFYQYRSWQSGRQLADLIAELDRNAGPWRLADLEARHPRIPDERNGALIVKAARLGLRATQLPERSAFDIPPPRVLPPELYVKLRESLEGLEANVKEARRLADFPEGSFSVKVAPDVISTLLPHVQNVREIGILLAYDANWQVEQGNFDQAIDSCRAAVHATRTIRDEPFLVSQLVRLAMLREVGNVTERLLAQGQPRGKLVQDFRQSLVEEADFDGWTTAIAGERAGMHQLFEYLAANKYDMRYLRGLAGMRSRWHDPITDRFMAINTHQSHAWLLRHLTEVLVAKDLPARDRHARLQELGERVHEAPALAHLLMAPVWRSTYSAFLRSDAKLRCAAAGLAAEEFRQEHARWPKSLDELAPKYLARTQFLDPYTSEPLQLRATPDGIVIFSVGPDSKLAGAALDEPKSADREMHRDHEFRLWNPNLRRQK